MLVIYYMRNSSPVRKEEFECRRVQLPEPIGLEAIDWTRHARVEGQDRRQLRRGSIPHNPFKLLMIDDNRETNERMNIEQKKKNEEKCVPILLILKESFTGWMICRNQRFAILYPKRALQFQDKICS